MARDLGFDDRRVRPRIGISSSARGLADTVRYWRTVERARDDLRKA